MFEFPPMPGIDMNDIDNIKIDETIDRQTLIDMFAMNINSNLVTAAKGYNMQQKVKLSKKRFPFPMKLYCNLKDGVIIMGTDSIDFPEIKIELNQETAKLFFPFKIICKLADEDTWCAVEIKDLEKAVYRFSNNKEFKYGY